MNEEGLVTRFAEMLGRNIKRIEVKSSVREEKGEREDRKKEGGEIMINGECE